MSTSEKVLWGYLRGDKLGFRFRRQVPAQSYFLDFYCGEAALCVEVDGEQHQQSAEYDAKRDQVLAQHGIETVRIPSLDIFNEDKTLLENWLRLIEAKCWERSSRPSTPQPPPPPGREEGEF
jgi:very-short-patch-repair endonuclease